jgi:hypothetical protein
MKVSNLKTGICYFFSGLVFKIVLFMNIFLISKIVLADIVLKPSFGIGSGDYLDQSYTELKVGGALHLVDLPIAFQLHGFRRFAHQFDDFYGLDLEVKLKRQFKISEQFLFGTFFGPGFRFVSNDFDAPTIDFSLVLSKAQIYSVFIGYKIIMLDWMKNDYKNDSLVYLGIQL